MAPRYEALPRLFGTGLLPTSIDASKPLGRPSVTAPGGSSSVALRARRHARRRRRVTYSLLAIGVVLVIGTAGFYELTGTGWVNSFYFECMLATGQGPPFTLVSSGAKLFAAFMAFVSVGTVVSTLIVNLGPVIGRLWREGIEEAERELRRVDRHLAEDLEEHR